MARTAQKMWDGIVASIGFAKGGPVGALAAREGAQMATSGAGWLKGRSMLGKPKGLRSVGRPAVGGIGANRGWNQLQQEQGSHP